MRRAPKTAGVTLIQIQADRKSHLKDKTAMLTSKRKAQKSSVKYTVLIKSLVSSLSFRPVEFMRASQLNGFYFFGKRRQILVNNFPNTF